MACRRLDPHELCLQVDPGSLGFSSTEQLRGQAVPWIGQARAEAAARFGLGMALPGYNLLVVGETGTGRTTLLYRLMCERAAHGPVPPDLLYLHQYERPEQPMAIRLPAGEGRLLRQAMLQLARRLQTDVPRRLAEPDVQSEMERIRQASRGQESLAFADLRAFAESCHFSLMRQEGHLVFTGLNDKGQPLTTDQAMALGPQARAAIDEAEAALREKMTSFMDYARLLERERNEQLTALRRRTIGPLLERAGREVLAQLHPAAVDVPRLENWWLTLQTEVLDHVELFEPGPDEEAWRAAALEDLLARLHVNLAVDNHGLQGAPVLQEDNPTYRQLFGCIEYPPNGEGLQTDWTRLRAGSLLRAHGGFLMLHLRDVLADPPVWERLRRFVRSGRLQIEEPGVPYAPIAMPTLSPEPVQADVKLVLLTSPEEFEMVDLIDPELARRFRCKVEFASSFVASPGTWQDTAVWVAHTCDRWGLPHFSATAMARLIEDNHRRVQDQFRQSAVFASVEALVMESAALAQARQTSMVEAGDVRDACAARRQRHNDAEEQWLDALSQGERDLPLTGAMEGSVNGLSVVMSGERSFGFPMRVTARAHAGDKGLLSIDREVELAGPLHNKGVLVLHSYLMSLFAHLAPVALEASLVFEQEYGEIEGDSASCAELYALLSALAGVPLAQGMAITGALNAQGHFLPVGAINEKIEGFFRSCERTGMDGAQGVIIPERNRRHLMLDESVRAAVAAGRFHIHAVSSVEEGMSLLCHLPWGIRGPNGYPPGSVLGKAEARLRRFRRAWEGPTAETGHRGASLQQMHRNR